MAMVWSLSTNDACRRMFFITQGTSTPNSRPPPPQSRLPPNQTATQPGAGSGNVQNATIMSCSCSIHNHGSFTPFPMSFGFVSVHPKREVSVAPSHLDGPIEIHRCEDSSRMPSHTSKLLESNERWRKKTTLYVCQVWYWQLLIGCQHWHQTKASTSPIQSLWWMEGTAHCGTPVGMFVRHLASVAMWLMNTMGCHTAHCMLSLQPQRFITSHVILIFSRVWACQPTGGNSLPVKCRLPHRRAGLPRNSFKNKVSMQNKACLIAERKRQVNIAAWRFGR